MSIVCLHSNFAALFPVLRFTESLSNTWFQCLPKCHFLLKPHPLNFNVSDPSNTQSLTSLVFTSNYPDFHAMVHTHEIILRFILCDQILEHQQPF